mgnify:CR=1 FL=1
MSRLKTPKKPKKAKPAKLLYREPAKRMSRKERKLKEKRRKQINKHIDHAMGLAIALCTVSAILDVKNNKDS